MSTNGSAVETPPTPSRGVSARMDSTSPVRKHVSQSDTQHLCGNVWQLIVACVTRTKTHI